MGSTSFHSTTTHSQTLASGAWQVITGYRDFNYNTSSVFEDGSAGSNVYWSDSLEVRTYLVDGDETIVNWTRYGSHWLDGDYRGGDNLGASKSATSMNQDGSETWTSKSTSVGHSYNGDGTPSYTNTSQSYTLGQMDVLGNTGTGQLSFYTGGSGDGDLAIPMKEVLPGFNNFINSGGLKLSTPAWVENVDPSASSYHLTVTHSSYLPDGSWRVVTDTHDLSSNSGGGKGEEDGQGKSWSDEHIVKTYPVDGGETIVDLRLYGGTWVSNCGSNSNFGANQTMTFMNPDGSETWTSKSSGIGFSYNTDGTPSYTNTSHDYTLGRMDALGNTGSSQLSFYTGGSGDGALAIPMKDVLPGFKHFVHSGGLPLSTPAWEQRMEDPKMIQPIKAGPAMATIEVSHDLALAAPLHA